MCFIFTKVTSKQLSSPVFPFCQSQVYCKALSLIDVIAVLLFSGLHLGWGIGTEE